jgi:rRNA maturation endonuclease Nob1
MDFVRRCLGCQATYPADGHACPDCDSHAGQVEAQQEQQAARSKDLNFKPARRRTRKT